MHQTVMNAEAIAASGTFTSDAISLGVNERALGLYYVITGTGTVTFNYLATVDGINYVTKQIAADKTAGADILEVDAVPCEAIKIQAVETGAANAVTITAKLCAVTWF